MVVVQKVCPSACLAFSVQPNLTLVSITTTPPTTTTTTAPSVLVACHSLAPSVASALPLSLSMEAFA